MRDVPPNFSPQAQDLILQSKILCISLGGSSVVPDHLLISILKSAPPKIISFLNDFDLNIKDYVDFIVTFSSLSKLSSSPSGSPPYSGSFKACLTDAASLSSELRHGYIGPEHLFFSVINLADGSTDSYLTAIEEPTRDFVKSFVAFLKQQDTLLNEFHDYPHPGIPYPGIPPPESAFAPGPPPDVSPIEAFCTDITQLYGEGRIDPVIGRAEEIDRIIEILCRKTKNNPLLLGEPGVGKTACIEGLSAAIFEHKCPPLLINKKVLSVDLASMIAGTKYRGQFEQRLKSLIKECISAGDIFLFIDEIHTLVGAGNAEGAMDAVNILKPSLSRGQVTVIGSTTFSEYKKSIEKDGALSRRFQTVQIDEPSKGECLSILKGLKSSYEKHHGVHYSTSILRSIVELADRYLPNRFFPDKAIDILDEAGAKLNIENSTPPSSIADIENKILSLPDRAQGTEEESMLMDSYDAELLSWKDSVDPFVSNTHIQTVLSKKAKIPLDIIERSNISLSLKKSLQSRIIGQDSAVSQLYNNILRSELGFEDPVKPTGSFLFLGATGTGKTFLAKLLAEYYFGVKNIIRFDMSEYSEGTSVSKLTGASPGYVGYDEGGSLIEKIKKYPYSVVLLDEIEKAHPKVQQLLLQVLEEGELEDNQGNKGYFHHSIIILTSNIGADLLNKSSLGFSPTTSNDEKIFDLAKSILSPELINRLDDVIIFNNLSFDDLFEIFDKEMASFLPTINSHNCELAVDDSVKELICKKAVESKMGARPLRRLISTEIIDSILPMLSSNRKRCYNKSKEILFHRREGLIKCKLKGH